MTPADRWFGELLRDPEAFRPCCRYYPYPMAYLRPLALLVAFLLTAWLWFFSDQKWFALVPLTAAVIIGLLPLFRR